MKDIIGTLNPEDIKKYFKKAVIMAYFENHTVTEFELNLEYYAGSNLAKMCKKHLVTDFNSQENKENGYLINAGILCFKISEKDARILESNNFCKVNIMFDIDPKANFDTDLNYYLKQK